MPLIEFPKKDVKYMTVLLISNDGLSKMMEVPETIKETVETVLANGRKRKYLYTGFYAGTFSQKILAFKEVV